MPQVQDPDCAAGPFILWSLWLSAVPIMPFQDITHQLHELQPDSQICVHQCFDRKY